MIKLIHLAIAFSRVGILGFGGGPSFVPLIQIEVVEKFHWLTHEEFADLFAFGNTLPGPIATKLAGVIGFRIAGIAGATVGLVSIVLPSILAMLLLGGIYWRFRHAPWLEGMLRGARPVVIALLVALLVDLVPGSLPSAPTWLIFGVSFIAIQYLHIHPGIVIVAALVLGATALRP